MPRHAKWMDSALLFVLTAILIWPLFRLKYLDNWPSIESTFISDARLLREHLPHPGWQPLWYCGTRFDYIYPPALLYGTALISKAFAMTMARAYHLYVAVFYCLGIVAVYWLVLVGGASRWFAWLAAAATALLSPSFLFLHDIRLDSFHWVPQRLHVLMLYGEGPHMSALAILPAALAATFLAIQKRRPLAVLGAAALCALTVASNFYGATSLAILFPLVVWCTWIGLRDSAVWLRTAAIVGLAYGLSAFWLTPSFLRLTAINLRWVALPGALLSKVIGVAIVGAFFAISFVIGNRRPQRSWILFVSGAVFLMSVYILGLFFFGFRTVGEPARLVPEFDLVLILLAVEVLRKIWTYRRIRYIVVPLILFGFYPALDYLQHPYFPFPKAQSIENRIEYRMTKWANDHLPGQRIHPSGTIRFWFNTWFSNPQSEGGSQQGMLNQVLPYAYWEITHGTVGETAILWLKAVGADAVIVPDKTSLEPYRDYSAPHKYQGVAPVLFDDEHGTVIYRVPRRFPGIGRVVDSARLRAAGKIPGPDDAKTVARYVDAVENAEQSETQVVWRGFDRMDVHANVAPGQSVLLQETYDPAWHAYEGSRRIPIQPDPVLGFMLLSVPAGDHAISLRFETPLENRLGQILLILTLALMGTILVKHLRASRPAISQTSSD